MKHLIRRQSYYKAKVKHSNTIYVHTIYLIGKSHKNKVEKHTSEIRQNDNFDGSLEYI